MKQIALLMATALAALAQAPPPVEEIMARVGANQAKSIEARTRFVYKEEVLAVLRHTNGKTACREEREYTVVPGANGAMRKVVKSESSGKCDEDSDAKATAKADGSAAQSMTDSVVWEKDGVPRDLFPLTEKEQRYYDYRLVTQETYRGRPVYRIAFEPKKSGEEADTGDWKGEALIDAQEFEPILVTTTLAQKVPLAVRVLLGTNVRGLGFSVSYERVADGVWFPVSFGGEFKLNVLFFYRRTISINLKNSDFKRTDVNSNIAYDKIQ
jgi:hypothetical protein